MPVTTPVNGFEVYALTRRCLLYCVYPTRSIATIQAQFL